jgi:hypothetical protein
MLDNLKCLPDKEATVLKNEITTAQSWLLGRKCSGISKH